ncbi:MAG: BON domain-containing protein [Chromatiales bacterium]
MRHSPVLSYAILIVLAPSLAGCAGVVAGGAAGTAVAAHDQRTTGTLVEDQAIELKALRRLSGYDQIHVSVTSYNNIVLVTGEAPNEELRREVIEIVRNIEKVRRVHDEITIAAPSSMTSRTSDTILTGKVKAQLFGIKNFDATRVKVVTEKGVVYLMGLLTRKESDSVTEVARRIGGVQRVVKLFEYTD